MAARYLVSGGTGNWNSTTNWSATSGGASGASFPVAADAVIIDLASGNANLTINVASSCTSITIANAHTGTLTMSNTLTISGNITLGSGMTSIGTSDIRKSGNGTLTTNGHIFSGGLTFPNSATLTLADDCNFLNFACAGFVAVLSGVFTFRIRASLNIGNGVLTSVIGNITTVEMIGTGNLNGSLGGTPASTSPGPNLVINTSGTITQSATVNLVNTTVTRLSGSFNANGQNVGLGLGVTFNTGASMVFFSMSRISSGVGNITLLDDLYVSSNFLNPVGTTLIIGTGRTIFVGGNLAPGFTGDITFEFYSSSNSSILTGGHGTNMTINKSGGAIVTLGNLTFTTSNRTYTYTAGVIDVGVSICTITNGQSVTINGWTFYSLTIGGLSTLTINSRIYINNNLTLAANADVTFNGTSGWDCYNLLCSTASRIITLQSFNTYNTINNVAMLGTNASRITIRSNAPTVSYAIWTLQNPATQSMVYVNGQGVDSNAGMTIYSFGGTILTSLPALNWYNGASQGTKAFTYVS
jgi:hypothetical protein